MGLRDLLRKWSKGEDQRAVERAQEAAKLSPLERDLAGEDFEGRKDDASAFNTRAGSEAADAARGELDDPLP